MWIDFIFQWEEVIDMGNAEDDEKLENVLDTISVNECCTLVYTVSRKDICS